MAFNNFAGFNPASRRARVASDTNVPGAFDPGYYPQPLSDEDQGPPVDTDPTQQAAGHRGGNRGGDRVHQGGNADFTTHEAAGLKRAWGPVGTNVGGMGYNVQGNLGPQDWGNPQFYEKNGGKAAVDPLYLTELYRSWLPQTEPFFPKQFIKSGG